MSESVEEKLVALSAKLAEAEKDEPVLLTKQQSFAMLVRRHGSMVAQYQEEKLSAKLANLSGNKAAALQSLQTAAVIFSQIKALRAVAQNEGLGEEYDRVMAQFKQNQAEAGKNLDPAGKPIERPTHGGKRASRRRQKKQGEK